MHAGLPQGPALISFAAGGRAFKAHSRAHRGAGRPRVLPALLLLRAAPHTLCSAAGQARTRGLPSGARCSRAAPSTRGCIRSPERAAREPTRQRMWVHLQADQSAVLQPGGRGRASWYSTSSTSSCVSSTVGSGITKSAASASSLA
jgi:hypothetical protein